MDLAPVLVAFTVQQAKGILINYSYNPLKYLLSGAY